MAQNQMGYFMNANTVRNAKTKNTVVSLSLRLSFSSSVFLCSSFNVFYPKKARSRSCSSIWLGDSAPESSDGLVPKGLP